MLFKLKRIALFISRKIQEEIAQGLAIFSSIFLYLFLTVLPAWANPLVLSDDSLTVLPYYLWGMVGVILFCEAAGVSFILKWMGFKFWRLLGVLMLLNLFLFAVFSPWLIVINRYEPEVSLAALVAELIIITAEAWFLYKVAGIPQLATPNVRPLSIIGAGILSLAANLCSMFSGLILSYGIYSWLYHTYDFPMP